MHARHYVSVLMYENLLFVVPSWMPPVIFARKSDLIYASIGAEYKIILHVQYRQL